MPALCGCHSKQREGERNRAPPSNSGVAGPTGRNSLRTHPSLLRQERGSPYRASGHLLCLRRLEPPQQQPRGSDLQGRRPARVRWMEMMRKPRRMHLANVSSLAYTLFSGFFFFNRAPSPEPERSQELQPTMSPTLTLGRVWKRNPGLGDGQTRQLRSPRRSDMAALGRRAADGGRRAAGLRSGIPRVRSPSPRP